MAQPLLLLSGILLPLAFAPGLAAAGRGLEPVRLGESTATRALFAGDLGDDSVWQALLILAVLTALSLGWAARSFARSVR